MSLIGGLMGRTEKVASRWHMREYKECLGSLGRGGRSLSLFRCIRLRWMRWFDARQSIMVDS